MNPVLADEILEEYERLRNPQGDPVLEAVRTAVFVEDVFGIVLTDDQITPTVLGDPASLRALVVAAIEP